MDRVRFSREEVQASIKQHIDNIVEADYVEVTMALVKYAGQKEFVKAINITIDKDVNNQE